MSKINLRSRALEDLQLFRSDLLAAIARGEIDLNHLAKVELASRGLNSNGEWIGFEKAREILGVGKVEDEV